MCVPPPRNADHGCILVAKSRFYLLRSAYNFAATDEKLSVEGGVFCRITLFASLDLRLWRCPLNGTAVAVKQGAMITTNNSTTKKLVEIERGFAFANHAVHGEGSHAMPFTQKWEYCIFEFKGMHSDQDRTERVDELNKLGAAGWEPAGTTSGGSQYHEYLIFKRLKA